MSIKSFRAFSILLITASANAQNAAYDSVSVGDALKNQTQQMGLNGSRPDISTAGNNWNDHSVQCTAPQPDGAGHCLSSCTDGIQNSYTGSCPVQPPPQPQPQPDRSIHCTAPSPDGNGNCVSTCSDGSVISYVGSTSCGGTPQ